MLLRQVTVNELFSLKMVSLYKELHRGELTRKQFFQKVVDVMSSISGGMADDLI